MFDEYLMTDCFAGGRGAAGIKGSPGSPGSAGLPGFPVRFHGFEALVSIWKMEHSGNTVASHTGCQFGTWQVALDIIKALNIYLLIK